MSAGATVTFGSCGSDQRGGGEQHVDHGDNPGRECRCGDGDGDQRWVAEWEFSERVHLRGDTDSEQCEPEQRTGGGWNSGDDHGDELCGGSDGEVWSHGSDQRGGGEQHIDYGDDVRRGVPVR